MKKNLENESLSSLLKKVEQAAAKRGLSPEELGITEDLMRSLEDLEDNVTLRPEDIYQKGYRQRRGERCVKALLDMCVLKRGAFRESFLLSGCLKNPLGGSYKEEDYTFTMNILASGIHEAEEREYGETGLGVMRQCLLYTDVLYKNARANERCLQANPFSRYTLPEQLLMICIFIQDQTRLAKERVCRQYAGADVITGMEPAIAPAAAEDGESQAGSLVDNFEAVTQYLNNLIRFLYYDKRKELKADRCEVPEGVHPFLVPEFQQIVELSMQRVLYCELEERFRYSNWNICIAATPEGEEACLFRPGDADAHLAHLTAGVRRNYQMLTTLYRLTETAPDEDEALDRIFSHTGAGNDLESWTIDKAMFQRARPSVRPVMAASLSVVPYLLNYRINGHTVQDIARGYEFLRILSGAYIHAIYAGFDPSDHGQYQSLAPVVSLEYLIENFSRLYGCETSEASAILGYYIFDGGIRLNDGDIFTRPLIKVSGSQVILCQSLIEQVNLARNLQKWIKAGEVDICETGRVFEENFKARMSKSRFLSVCRHPVEFQAYDGKTAEFDFAAVFGGCLLLVELKCLMIPYGGAELYDCRKAILNGVEQVKRRKRVVLKDWEQFKRAAGIDLPDEPYPPENIICMVCTNLYDFTGLEIDGIPVIDDFALDAYFVHPDIVQNVKRGGATVSVGVRSLWKEGRPSVPEFLEYLSNPFPNSLITGKHKMYRTAIPPFEGVMPVALEDYHLSEDPFRSFMLHEG